MPEATEMIVDISTTDGKDAVSRRPPKISPQSQNKGASWVVLRTLGEGAFGEVKLVAQNDQVVAMKVIDLIKHPEGLSSTKKEALIQKLLTPTQGRHPNILAYIGMRHIEGREFQIFMEYADGGELFDKIEPDVGMKVTMARKYFRQLISGIEFIHSLGVVHRDIKPENLLLTSRRVLKISDFGMATVFRNNGVERPLNMPCGTMPYASPEVLARNYKARPCDLWSCGVVLVTLLAGELPWEAPIDSCLEYVGWRDRTTLHKNPWSKMDTQALTLLRHILNNNEDTRATVEQIKEHPWVCNKGDGSRPPAKKRKLVREVQDRGFAATQQPCPSHCTTSPVAPPAFSQPLETIFLSQSQPTQFSGDPLQRMAKRFTRICVMVDRKTIISRLISECEAEGWTIKQRTITQVIVQCPREMCFIISIYIMTDSEGKSILLDFRRSKGDGLEFKRAFKSLRARLDDIVCEQGTWMLQSRGLVDTSTEGEDSEAEMENE